MAKQTQRKARRSDKAEIYCCMALKSERHLAWAWLDYCRGECPERPVGVPARFVRWLAFFGHVDPVYGYEYDDAGRSMARPLGGRKVRGTEPAALRRYRLERRASATEWQSMTYRDLND